MRCISFAVGFFGLVLGAAFAADSGGSLKKLAADMQKAIAAMPQPKDGQASRPDASRMIVAQLQMAIARGETMQIESILQQAAAVLDSDAIREECIQVSTQLQAERQATAQKKLAEMEMALKAAGAAVHSAKKAQELDGAIQMLGALQNQRDAMSGSMAMSVELNKVQSALRFLTRWQDYLSAMETDQRENAREILQSLSSMDGYAVQLIPRSEILARLNGGPATAAKNYEDFMTELENRIAAIISRIKTPDDLAGALLELLKIDPENRAWHGDGRALIEALSALNDSYREFNAGMATQIEAVIPNITNYPRLPNPVPAVRSQILTLVLPRYLGLPPEMTAKPFEGPGDFLKRISTEAAARGDYQLAAKADDTDAYLRYGKSPRASDSQASLFITAQNQETAGQFALAVASYQRALALPYRAVPPKVIGERLAAINAEHPPEFEQGMVIYREPVSPVIDPRSPLAVMLMRQQMMREGGVPQPTPQPFLSVPPAPPKPAATAKSAPTPKSVKP